MGKFISPVAIVFWLGLLSVAFVSTGWVMAWQLIPERGRAQQIRWLRTWSIKGLLVPFALWVVMNIGVSRDLQPFMPQIQAAQNSGGSWFPAFVRIVMVGLFVITSYWAATTLGWIVVREGVDLEEDARANFKALCWTCSLGMLLPALIIVLLGGWPLLGMAATAILAPIAGYMPSILHTRKLPPMYARAVARMKFGKYTEAEKEIIRELEKCDDDFEGWMMMADLYANHFNDLAGAEQVILEICDQPRTTTSQLSIALHRLADWQLKLGGDLDAARRTLQMICDRLRGTHLAHMAQLRINQLPKTPEELRAVQSSKPIPLPALGDRLDAAPEPPGSESERREAATRARAYVEDLKQDPNNVAAREQLARVFAEQLGQADRGIEQLTLLLDMAGHEDAKRAEWMALTAAWHIKYRQDAEAARETLERLIREFPQSPQALAARRRLQLMD